ncbi:MAG: H(+)-transporting two-sector ATPase [Phycisphaerales bacterium]|nr:H(+)-transporting two-sector ATPase [Phycisphaerales bacterium]
MPRPDPRSPRLPDDFPTAPDRPDPAPAEGEAAWPGGSLLGRPGPLDREVLWWLLLGLASLAVLGLYLLRLPGAGGSGALNVDRAIFSSVSAVTLTGLRQVIDAAPGAGGSDGQLLVPLTLLGLTLGASFVTLAAAGLPACRVLGMSHSAKRVCAAAGVLVVGGTLLGSLGLWNGARSYLDALVQAASAVGNSGVFWGRLPRGDGWQTQVVLLPLSVLGGLGLPVVLDLYDRATGRTTSLLPHTKLVLGLSAAAYGVGAVLLLAFDERFASLLWGGLTGGGWTPADGRALRSLVVDASVLSLNARSGGFPLEPGTLAALPRAAGWVLTLLMAAGPGPAGTGGGLKLTTLYLLGTAARRGADGERQPPECGFALLWAMGFAGVVGVGLAGLLWAAPEVPGDRLLALAVSATSNSGLAHDAIVQVKVPLMILAGMMVLGRVLPILLLWRMADRVDHAETVVG